VTPSVTAPGDSNLSDANGCMCPFPELEYRVPSNLAQILVRYTRIMHRKCTGLTISR